MFLENACAKFTLATSPMAFVWSTSLHHMVVNSSGRICNLNLETTPEKCALGGEWGQRLNASAVLGTHESLAAYCSNRKLPHSLSLEKKCLQKGVNLYRVPVGRWTMCKNAQWLICAVQGRACRGGRSCNSELIISHPWNETLAPAFNQKLAENHIYAMELCILSKICTNGDEVRTQPASRPFKCNYDAAAWVRLRHDITPSRQNIIAACGTAR